MPTSNSFSMEVHRQLVNPHTPHTNKVFAIPKQTPAPNGAESTAERRRKCDFEESHVDTPLNQAVNHYSTFSFRTSALALGSSHFMASRVWTSSSLTARLRNHLLFAGMMCQGAWGVLHLPRASS